MKMPHFLRKLLPGCPAERVLDEQIAATKALNSKVLEMVDDVTTVFDRRKQEVTPLAERRKASAA